MQAGCAVDGRPKRTKSRLRTLDDLDNRTRAAQYAQKLVLGLQSDLGGADQISTAKRELIKRIALAGALAEDLECRWLQGEPVDLDEYAKIANVQRRLLATIGLERRAKDITEVDPLFRQFVDAYNKPEAA